MSHPAVSPASKFLLDDEAISRTLSRIAHEIIERNEDLGAVALVGIHTRGVPLAHRLRRLVESARESCAARPAGHHLSPRRRSRSRRPASAARTARRPRHEARLRARGPHGDPRRRRPLHRPDDSRGDRRSVRVRPPDRCSSPCSPIAATASSRSGPTTSARTSRPLTANVCRSSWSRSTRSTAYCLSPVTTRWGSDRPSRGWRRPLPPPHTRRHLLSTGDLTRDDVERLLSRARSFALSQERDNKKLPTLRGRLVLNVFYESSTRTSSSFELAAKRLSADTLDAQVERLVGRQGRVAEGHGADAVGLRPRRDRDQPPRSGRRRLRRRARRCVRRQRRRRQAPASDASAPRPAHDARGIRAPRGPARRDRR